MLTGRLPVARPKLCVLTGRLPACPPQFMRDAEEQGLERE
ncbi:hypothetical protein CBM2633_U10005 [Cupriavidus taiwanensis]|nr:hypothetical protein CBM2633_U10005 [Cupriavidus taiwanensis]